MLNHDYAKAEKRSLLPVVQGSEALRLFVSVLGRSL